MGRGPAVSGLEVNPPRGCCWHSRYEIPFSMMWGSLVAVVIIAMRAYEVLMGSLGWPGCCPHPPSVFWVAARL